VEPTGGSNGRPASDRRFTRELGRAVAGEVSVTREDRLCYAYDATDLKAVPDVVVWPRSTADVVAVVRFAAEHGLPVVPRGAGTGYTGGSVPIAGGIALSFEAMNRVLSIDAGRKLAVVEPGIVNDDLRRRVEAMGLTYPPDPASLKVSTIGGNLAEGAGGPRTVLYGTTRDYVVGIEAVLPDGSVVSTGTLSPDGANAWDLGPLIVGSEGTLAIVTKVALRLSLLPAGFATYWAEFPTLEAAASAVAAITAAGFPVSVLEILDRETTSCALEYVRGTPPKAVPDGALLIELEGGESELASLSERLLELLRESGATALRAAAEEDEREEIWEIRRSISPSLARLSSGKINEDIAVPRSAIPVFVRAMREIGREAGLPIHAFGHAGDGNLHVNVMVERSDRDEMRRARRAVSRLFAAALSMGGTLSGEHGIGITKADHLALEIGEAAFRVSGRVKRAFDPRGILNPDKILTDRPNPWWRDLPPDDVPEPGPGPDGRTEEESDPC
jgi:glycolate oxidase